MVESLSTVVAVELARYFNNSGDDLRVRTREGRFSQADLSRIVEFIECAENRCPSIEEIAKVCDISPAHLRRSFKKTTGKTVHDYVEAIRLKKAQSLLADTDLPLKEISYRLGFSNSSTFSSTFKRTSGQTPSDYRYLSRQ
ncbi:MAG: helix-turn-helix transcriptional regulator, partial [Sphingomonadaceae bacterium]